MPRLRTDTSWLLIRQRLGRVRSRRGSGTEPALKARWCLLLLAGVQPRLEVLLGGIRCLLRRLELAEWLEERRIGEGEVAGTLGADPVALPPDPEVRQARRDGSTESGIEGGVGLGRDHADGGHERLVIRGLGEFGEIGQR